PRGTGFLAEVCARWESATKPAEEAGIRVVRMRTGPVLAASGGVLDRLLVPFRIGLGGRVGTRAPYFCSIALGDHVAAILHHGDGDGVAGACNHTAPRPVTNREFTETLGRVLHRPTRIPTPLLPLKLWYGSELVDALLLSGQRVLPKRLEAAGYRFAHPTLEEALRAALDRH